MFKIDCPFCGPRDASDYSYGGEAHIARPDNSENLSDEEWADFVFMRGNVKGAFAERWVHTAGCRRFFNVIRDTATDEILVVYKIGGKVPAGKTSGLNTPCGEAIGSGNDAVQVIGEDQE